MKHLRLISKMVTHAESVIRLSSTGVTHYALDKGRIERFKLLVVGINNLVASHNKAKIKVRILKERINFLEIETRELTGKLAEYKKVEQIKKTLKAKKLHEAHKKKQKKKKKKKKHEKTS